MLHTLHEELQKAIIDAELDGGSVNIILVKFKICNELD